MTPEQLHDALGMLPADLISETDKLRSRPVRKVLYWKKTLTAAACFLLIVGCGLFAMNSLPSFDGTKEAAREDAMIAAPAAPAPMEMPESAIQEESANSLLTDNAPEEGIPEPEEACRDLMEGVPTGEGWVLAAYRQKSTLTGLEYLGDSDLLPGILKALGCTQGSFRIPGTTQNFAMFAPLVPGEKSPAHLGFAFD